MRTITFIFAVLVLATSCKKSQSYECQSVYVITDDSTNVQWTDHTFTESQKDQFEKSNTIDKDGIGSELTPGEVTTKCVIK